MTFDEVPYTVPGELLSAGCPYCTNGWANGPGLVYRCQCNPGEPHTISVPEPATPTQPSLWTRFKALSLPEQIGFGFYGLGLLVVLYCFSTFLHR
jgi:hypothetical protein